MFVHRRHQNRRAGRWAGGWYADCTLEGDTVVLFRDSHIEINGEIIDLPPNQSNLLQLVCTRWNGQVLVAGQGQSFNNWLWRDDKWNDLGPSFATFVCAFGADYLYCVVGPNQYVSFDLNTLEKTPVIPRAIGVNGIRYIDFGQSIDGIVTGDSTYGPIPYNISQWTKRDDVVCGQSYIDGCVALYFGQYRLIEPGDTQFIRFKKSSNKICLAIVKMEEVSSVFYWMDVEDLTNFPIQQGNGDPDNMPGPIVNGDNMLQAPNKLSTVQRMMKLHPEIDTMDEEERGVIIDLSCKAENPVGKDKPWGRKSRNKEGTDLNTDAMTYLRTDGKFEIYDVISGGDGSATWDLGTSPTNSSGIWSQGENGYWAPANKVENGQPIPPVPVEPTKPPISVNKDDVRDGTYKIIAFYNEPVGLNRAARGVVSPLVVNDGAMFDWQALYVTYLAQGDNQEQALKKVFDQIKTFPEYKEQHP